MSPENHRRVRQLFDEALERPAAERSAFLQSACGDDSEIFGEVTQLLAANRQAAGFLEKEPARPARIGRYVIQGELGRGAMGIVYEANDPLIERRVAVKVIRLAALADSNEAAFLRERLFREARSAGSLFHPGIVVILDVGQEGDVAFIAMEYVDGPSLFQVLSKPNRLDRAEALRIVKQTAAALDYAHSHGVVHRDIKPANIMLEKGAAVKVTDFGIAKITTSAHYTQTGLTMGTPSYMSPEQIDAKPLDGKSDQFSLAVMAYELLTGAKPFEPGPISVLAHAIVFGPRPSAHAANAELPAKVDAVFNRGLAKASEERYATCSEFAEALEVALAEPVPEVEEVTRVTIRPAPLSPPPVVEPPRRTPPRYAMVGAMVVLLLIGAAVGYKRLTRQAIHTVRPEPSPASSVQSRAMPPDPSSAKGGVSTVTEKPKPGMDPTTRRHQLYVDGLAKLRGQKFSEAAALFHNAADLGETHAMVALGKLFMEDGALHDEQQALRWFRKAAESGDADGMLHLGAAYDVGMGVGEDDGMAVEWYRKAADRGSADAAYDLAKKYESGQGVKQDVGKAREYFERAAKLGNRDAKEWLARGGGR